ncbi:MAG: hypothetical protein ACLQAH_00700 [Limisphaerales bacterium]
MKKVIHAWNVFTHAEYWLDLTVENLRWVVERLSVLEWNIELRVVRP